MFSSIGWGEVFVILIFGLIIIGPERLPEVIKDIRAAIYAARKAINNAKKELDGTIGEEFKEPISKVAQIRGMTPQGVLSKALFDDDDTILEDLNPKNLLGIDPAQSRSYTPNPLVGGDRPPSAGAAGTPGGHRSAGGTEDTQGQANAPRASGGGSTASFSDPTGGWDDIT